MVLNGLQKNIELGVNMTSWILVIYHAVACTKSGCDRSWVPVGEFSSEKSCLVAIDQMQTAKPNNELIAKCLRK